PPTSHLFPYTTLFRSKCLCPSHDEDRPSCSVNFDVGAIKCQACGFKGDVISIIRRREECSYAEALRRTEEILGERYQPVSGKSPRKSGRRVFGQSGVSTRRYGGRQVSSRVRGRPTPWT